MSWTPCEKCGEACREYGPLCDFCDRESRPALPAATTVEVAKEDARESEHRELKGGGRSTGKAHRRGTRGAFGGRRRKPMKP